jgi:peptidylprolyl isomerase
MAVIAKSKCTFHQKHQGSNIQCDGNYNLNHGLNRLTAAKLILECAKRLLKLQIPRKIRKFAFEMKKKRTNPYKEANEAFLREKAQEEGMHVLDNGVMYRVLEEGHGTKKPTPRSIVYAHYTGKLIDGAVFDTTEGDQLPALFMVGDLIMGWQIALTRMHEGDKWEVIIPAKWAYGSAKMEDIPAWSTLIFDLELVKIER